MHLQFVVPRLVAGLISLVAVAVPLGSLVPSAAAQSSAPSAKPAGPVAQPVAPAPAAAAAAPAAVAAAPTAPAAGTGQSESSALQLTPAGLSMPGAPAPSVAASSWLLVDLTSRQTIAGQNPAERRDPASLTKLMTAYLVFSALRQKQLTLEQTQVVSPKAWKTEGSRMFIEPNRPVKIDELLRGMIVQSGNDASVALAEAVSGSEEAFAELMNREAQRLGMKDSSFRNATGLSHPQHYSTAADIARLAAAIIREFPEYYPLYSIKEYRYNNITQPNRNRLLWTDQYVDGMKTGYTEAAGYCLVATAKRGTRRLLTVVMGTGSDSARAIESQKLLNHGFQFYETPRLYEKNQQIAEIPVWKGAAPALAVGFTDDVFMTLPKGIGPKLKVALEAKQPLTAPIALGQPIGTLKLMLDGNAVATLPVQALNEVPLAGIFGRAWDSVRLWFR